MPSDPPADHSQAAGRPLSPLHGSSPAVRFLFDGREFLAREGQTVAAALWEAGQRTLRYAPRRNEPRGLLCGIGVCHECLVRIDGRPNTQACLTLVRPGMQVETQQGCGDWGGSA